MSGINNKEDVKTILSKYDKSIQVIFSQITKLEGNATLKKSDKRIRIKEFIYKEAEKYVD